MASAFLRTNLTDAGTVTAETQVTAMPASLVQGVHVRKRWRSTANAAYLLCDLGASLAPNSFALFGLTLNAGATCRLRVSTVDSTGAAGDALDTGALADGSTYLDADYGSFVWLGDAITGRYVRFDLSDPAGAFVEAGRMVVGVRASLAANFVPGSARSRVDLSRRARTEGGQTLIQRRARFRTLDLSFDWVEQAEWETLVEPIDREAGLTEDILAIVDENSTNLPRDTVWGLVSDMSPVGFTPIPDVYSKQYRIEERL